MFIQQNSLCLALKYEWIKHEKSSLQSVFADHFVGLANANKIKSSQVLLQSILSDALAYWKFDQGLIIWLDRWIIGWWLDTNCSNASVSHRSSNENSLNTWHIVAPRQHVVHEAGDWEELRGASFGFPVLQDYTQTMLCSFFWSRDSVTWVVLIASRIFRASNSQIDFPLLGCTTSIRTCFNTLRSVLRFVIFLNLQFLSSMSCHVTSSVVQSHVLSFFLSEELVQTSIIQKNAEPWKTWIPYCALFLGKVLHFTMSYLKNSWQSIWLIWLV